MRDRSVRRRFFWPLASGLALAGFGVGGWFVANGNRIAPARELIQKQLTSNPTETAVHSAAISPDGKTLAFADPTGTYLRAIQTGETRRLLAPEILDVTSIEWFPDGKRLAMTAISPNGRGVSAWTLPVTGGTPHMLRDNAIVGPISPDGSKVLIFNMEMRSQNWFQNGLWVMGTDGEDAHVVLPMVQPDDLRFAAWSPDGKRIVFIRATSVGDEIQAVLAVSDLSSAPPKVLLSDPDLFTTSCSSNSAWLPDGRILFTRSEPAPNQTVRQFLGPLDRPDNARRDPRAEATDQLGGFLRHAVGRSAERIAPCVLEATPSVRRLSGGLAGQRHPSRQRPALHPRRQGRLRVGLDARRPRALRRLQPAGHVRHLQARGGWLGRGGRSGAGRRAQGSTERRRQFPVLRGPRPLRPRPAPFV